MLVRAYRPADQQWFRGTDNPLARRWMAATAVGGDLYTIGGYIPADLFNRASVSGLTRRYSLSTNTWSSNLASLKVPRHSGKAVTLHGEPVVLGGTDSSTSATDLNSVEAYSPELGTWRTLEPMLRRRQDFAAVVLDGKIYAIGGSGDGATLSHVEVYAP